jgi:tRNA-specific 2-thiouridylase
MPGADGPSLVACPMRCVVALSGGVDSSVAAALLVEQGYEVIGAMLRLWAEPGAASRDNLCCAPEAVERARIVAERLRIPFHLVDARQRFYEAVVSYFIAEYAAARTPNPCIPCNREVRFGLLLDWAREQGVTHLATGHYARTRLSEGRHQLLRGRDPLKDQSYVLHGLSQDQVASAIFPLGDLTKAQVRALARERGLPVAEQPESQDVCFLTDGDYRRFLAEHAPEAARPGPILDTAGRVLGQHAGLSGYTVGQRKGIGVAAPRPLYVVALDGRRNALVVGPTEARERMECTAACMNYISGEAPSGPFEAVARIRYRHRGAPAVATPLPGARLHVRFAHPQRDVTPGQYLVLYDDEVVLGGGVIEGASDVGEGLEREPG